MSKLFRKDKSFNKKVAWLMAMLLLMSPFFDMTWVKRAPKAASGEVVVVPNAVTFELPESMSLELQFDDSDIVHEEISQDTYVDYLNKNADIS